jgi:hypothetical protein
MRQRQPERLSDIPLAPCTIGGRQTGPAYTTLGEKFDMTEDELRSLHATVPLRGEGLTLFVGEGCRPLSASPSEVSTLIDRMAQDIGHISAGESFEW